MPKLPEVWLQFRGYNDYKAKKIAKPRLSEDLLECSTQQLFNLAGRASLASPAWQQTRLEIEGLANTEWICNMFERSKHCTAGKTVKSSSTSPGIYELLRFCMPYVLSLTVCVCVCAYYLVLWISVHFEHCSAAIRLLHQQLAFVQLLMHHLQFLLMSCSCCSKGTAIHR